MLYSPIHRRINQFNPKKLKHISRWRKEPDSVFFYYELDSAIFNLKLYDAFKSVHWQHLSQNPNSKILIYHGGDFLNLRDCNMFVETIERFKINPNQVWLVVMDSNYIEFVQKHLPTINICSLNHLLTSTSPPEINIDEPPDIKKYRFSALSRNYKPWRLDLYIGMLLNGVIDKTVYSFHNYNPYDKQKSHFSIQEMNQDLERSGYDVTDEKITEWMEQIPYDIPGAAVSDKWSDITYRTIESANINILIESHYEPFQWEFDMNNLDPREFSPAFVTEKTFKAFACVRPFVAVSTPFFLHDLQKLGYKTFSPYIDESYDAIIDDKERMKAILRELERISNLSESDFKILIEQCHDIAKHNYHCFIENKEKNVLADNWKWFKPYIL